MSQEIDKKMGADYTAGTVLRKKMGADYTAGTVLRHVHREAHTPADVSFDGTPGISDSYLLAFSYRHRKPSAGAIQPVKRSNICQPV